MPHPWVDLPQTEAIAAGFAATLAALRTEGATIIDFDLPELKPGVGIEHIAYPEVAAIHNERWHRHPETYGPDVAERLGEVFEIDPRSYVAAQSWRAQIGHIAEAALRDCDVLITPAVAANIKPIGDEEIDVAGKRVSYRPQLSRFSALVNHMGLPALVLPLDQPGTPPPSVQLIGRRWDEAGLLAVGSTLERQGVSRYHEPPIST